MVFGSLRSLIDKQVKRNVLTAKKSVHARGNSKHWNNKPSINTYSNKSLNNYVAVKLFHSQNIVLQLNSLVIQKL